MDDLDERIGPADCLSILTSNKRLNGLTESFVSSRLSANFPIDTLANFGSYDGIQIFDSPKPPLLRKLRFLIVIGGIAAEQARTLQAQIDKATWFSEVDEIQLDFECDDQQSPTEVRKIMQQFLSTVAFPSGPTLRITAYDQVSAERIFPHDGHSTSKADFDKWIPRSAHDIYLYGR